MSQITKLSGIALASTAAALFLSGCSSYGTSNPAAKTASVATVHCSGINACKGNSACKTATSACKGQNSCKGKGWIAVTKADCATKGGKVVN